ncbi:fibronectin type III domain-containing protein [Paenibacillus polymyxa]|uniref:fibronectin type III domain-containing protein n=1 Tax=Paenibacillus polymyxa TaxID=1406 RepID=UPI0020248E95|nr:fibronectin type III domain-containing protein [Paenibacillus polymyxa]URJ42205.3 fibronectin type III domain-containing protein [Paenibacillus polymyxa]
MSKKFMTTVLTFFLISIILLPSVTHAAALNKTVKGMLGFSPPEGTTAKASSIYSNYVAGNSIDGDIGTYWNASTFKGNIELIFPSPIEINFVHITTAATPPREISYTIYGLEGGKWVPISEQITHSLTATYTTSQPDKVKLGTYDGIKIDANGGSSWLAFNEITIGMVEAIDLKGQPQNSSAKLSWNTIKDATNYKINYGTQPNKYTDSISVEKDSAGNYVVPNLINGTTYYFQVVAIFNGVETSISNEAVVTPTGLSTTDPTTPGNPSPEEPTNPSKPGTTNPNEPSTGEPTDPQSPSGNRAILVVTMTTGLEKEFDLSMKEVNDFISWYEGKQAGSGSASYAVNKHDNNKGPFSSRKDYMLYDRILTFEVSEYSK